MSKGSKGDSGVRGGERAVGRTSATKPVGRVPAPVPRIELVVEQENGEPTERRFVLDGDVLRIGSHPSNECVLDDPLVSRLHCQLRNTPSGWQLLDAGSLNGTFVSGIRVRDADVGLPHCGITVGRSRIVVRAAPDVAPAAGLASPSYGALFGATPVMSRLYQRIDRIARTTSDVLIEGESGTGKELIAAEVVRRSARADKPFVIVDCGAIAPTLMESELFGHAKGSFTGADRNRVGAFEAAEGGTVFLDEIGELPLEMQPKLLRALAAREIRRTGENKSRPIDVRVIAATNRRLESEVNQGHFREDLYFRLSVLRIDVPPLRERLEDLPLLVASFVERLGVPDRISLFTEEVLERMRRHAWPGNVRELRNYVERFALFDDANLYASLAPGGVVATPDPPTAEEPKPEPAKVAPEPDTRIDIPFRVLKDRTIEEFERGYLSALLKWSGGNVSRAARKANLDRMYLHRLLQRHGLARSAPLED
ncbi:MAG: sigma 54-interacting transcriptional regulator [Polyangiaceae bacterium]